jgi:hypothetical protein
MAVITLFVREKFMVIGNELSNYHHLLFTLFCVTISGGSMTEDIIIILGSTIPMCLETSQEIKNSQTQLTFIRVVKLAGSIYKSKLDDFVFYNLKPVKLHVACIAEKNVLQDRTLDIGTRDKFKNKPRY